MKTNLYFFFCILCYMFLFTGVTAVGTNIPSKYAVTYFSSKNGVEDGLVNEIIQDHKGLLWFATWNGLYRYDGYNFKNYKSNTEDSQGLTNDRLLHVSEDKYGYLWILCYDSTAYRFNPEQELFEPIAQKHSGNFESIRVLSNGIVWLFCADGSAIRACTNSEDLSLTFKTYVAKKKTLPAGKIRSVFLDSASHEWILTDNGLYRIQGTQLSTIIPKSNSPDESVSFYSILELKENILLGSNNGKIYNYSLQTKQLQLRQQHSKASIISILSILGRKLYITDTDGFFIDHEDGNCSEHITLDQLSGLKDKNIKSAQVTQNGLLWLTHSVPGVTLFDVRTKSLAFIEGKDELGRPLNNETDFFTIEDANGVLWVHPKGGGFSYYDPAKKELIPFNTTEQPIKWKSNDRCFSAFTDKQGNLWMSTQLNRLKRITFITDRFHVHIPNTQDYELPDNEIRALYLDNKSRIWTGARDLNLSIYDLHFKLLHRFKVGKVYAVTQGSDGVFWVSTKGEGLIKVTETSHGHFDFQRYTHCLNDPYSLSNDNLYYTFEDSRKRLWIATYGGGLNLAERMPDGTLLFLNHRNLLKKYPIDRFYKVRHITEDSKGRIWISTTAGILMSENPSSPPEEIVFHSISREQGNIHSLSNNDVQMIKCMKNGKIFAITFGGGLNEVIQEKTNLFTCQSFTQKNGLISDIIYSMEKDSEGNLWLVTGGGLVKFITSKEQIQYPSEHIGFNMHFSEGIGITDGNRIFFGTNKGIFYFTPAKIHKSTFVPPIFFSSIWVNNKEVTSRKNPSILSFSPDNNNHIVLPPNNHSLRLVFSALDMIDTEYIQYAYTLEGFDKTYRLTDNGHEANYTNLPPGKYIFHIKSTNNEGIWVNNERTLAIEVLPTFTETVYADILFIILVILFVIGAIYIYTVFYRMKNKVKNEELIAQLKLNFFTNVSHELRTPLTLITGPLEMILSDGNLPEKIKETLNIVKMNSDRMQRLVGQILDFGKIQDNKMWLKIERTDIVLFTREIVNHFSAFAQERRMTLTFTSDMPVCFLWFDTDKIEKVIFNILSNAFKFTPNNKCIQISIKENAKAVVIQVSDQGIGIPDEKKITIFNRFENLVQGSMHSTTSSGIGLSLAKELIDMHRGDITVESNANEGSIFSIKLFKGKAHYPVDTEYILSDLQECVELNTKPEEIEESNGVPLQLMLIVEDNHELRLFIRQIFQGKFRLIEAQNGEEGLEKAFVYLPDIIITDIMMPVKDGIEMLKELREDERTSHIPAIVLTAKTDMDSILTGIRTGADDYIIKPFSVSYLQAKVESLFMQRNKLQNYYSKNQYITEQVVRDEVAIPQLSEKDAAFLAKLVGIMEQQMSNAELSVDDIVSHFSLSRTNFFHKLKSLTGLSPIMYIKEIRMRRAAELIREEQYSMSEIAYMVGFSDPHYFSKSFKSFWGMTSTEYAKSQLKK